MDTLIMLPLERKCAVF